MTRSRKTVLTVMGTRPEGIKMAPVIQELRRRSQEFKTVVCSTGQHREMLDQSLAFFGIVPDVDLKIMTHNQSLGPYGDGHAAARIADLLT